MLPEHLIGTTINDRYELLALLGKGRSGIVYRAVHKQLQRIVAVKVAFYDQSEDANALARFEREARSAAFLHHPNIVTVYDLGVVSNQYAYIVMEYLEGVDLGRVFGTEGRLPLARAARICSQICSALSHAHNKSVVHRDLKPTNVMLQDLEDYADFVKVVDFGLAKQVRSDGESSEGLTIEGQVFGTPAYMSPEQCQGKRVDARSDIYSLGCLCFKMLTGAMPITGMNIMDIMHGHVHVEPSRFDEVFPDGMIPTAVQNVVYKSLEKDPDRRQQSMAQFRQEFLDALTDQGSSSRSMSKAVELPDGEQTTHERLLTELAQAAQSGDAQSQYALSVKMDQGEGTPLNKDGAMQWLRHSAQNGFVEAQYQLGRKLLAGEGCTRNDTEAVAWLLAAAQQGSEQAAWQLAICYETGEGVAANLVEAIGWYQSVFRRGNPHAEQKLNTCYVRCMKEGIPAEGTIEWIQRSSVGREPENLYLMFKYMQRFTPNNGQDIIQALGTAAQLGHPRAQFELGVTYLNGQMVQRNDSEGVRYLKAAADAGEVEAALTLAGCVACGRGTPADPATAINLLQTAAQSDQPQAKAILGCVLLLGDGTPRNIARGAALLKEAADRGDSFAQWKLALCHRTGIGAVRDPKKCNQLFALSAENGFDQGPLWPWAVPQLRFQEAIEYFQSSGATGNKYGAYWLGIVYENGCGVARDLTKALEFYRTAVQRGVPEAEPRVARLQQTIATGRV